MFDFVHTSDNKDTIALKTLKISAVEKLFRLRNDVIASLEQILKCCQPVELGYAKEGCSLNYLYDGNKTTIKWSLLKTCNHLSFRVLQRATDMLDKLNTRVKWDQSVRERVKNINTIVTEEEEQNKEGLIVLLEKAHTVIYGVRKIITSTLHTTIRTTDEMSSHKYENVSVPYWETQATLFRDSFQQN
eukprot:9147_1